MALRQVKDTPTNTFATLNLLAAHPNASISDGNLKTVGDYSNNFSAFSSIGVRSGKYYTEFHIANRPSSRPAEIGIVNTLSNTQNRVGSDSTGWGYQNDYLNNGKYGTNNSFTSATAFTTGHIVGVLLNADDGSVTFYLNGTTNSSIIGSLSNLITDDFYYFCATSSNGTIVLNFGQNPDFCGEKTGGGNYPDANGLGSFYYQPPAGALALCSRNIQSVEQNGSYVQNYTSAKANFRAVTYTGNVPANNTTGSQNIDLGILADLIWIKDRNSGTNHNHGLFDSVRGFDKWAGSNTTSGQDDTANAYLSHVSGTTYNIGWSPSINSDTHKKIAWCWKAAGAPADNQAKIINEDGSDGTMSTADLKTSTDASITPSKVSANRQNGFSIVKYVSPDPAITNPSVPHGLNKAPDFVIIKPTSSAAHWIVKHVGLNSNADNTLRLDTTDKVYTDSNNWGGNHVTNTVVPLGNYSNSNTNKPSRTNIMYCWHSVAGYSKFGSYITDVNNPPFVYLGFRPAFLLIKPTEYDSAWNLVDCSRNEYNPTGKVLFPNEADQEYDYWANLSGGVDILSNGFRPIGNGSNGWFNANSSGHKIIYIAFAEQPGAFSNAR